MRHLGRGERPAYSGEGERGTVAAITVFWVTVVIQVRGRVRLGGGITVVRGLRSFNF